MGKGVDKLFLKLGNVPIIAHTLMKFQNCQAIKHINLVVRADARGDFQAVTRDYRISKVRQIVLGGAERQNSVWNGLEAVSASTKLVAIQDAARPCTSEALIEATQGLDYFFVPKVSRYDGESQCFHCFPSGSRT